MRKFAHSLLQCLDLLYRNKIIHCDMKPENVLLKQQGRSGIKVGQKNNMSTDQVMPFRGKKKKQFWEKGRKVFRQYCIPAMLEKGRRRRRNSPSAAWCKKQLDRGRRGCFLKSAVSPPLVSTTIVYNSTEL